MEYFTVTNFPSDDEHEEMMSRTLELLKRYKEKPESYEKEAQQRGVSNEYVQALYIVGAICSGLIPVETEQRVARKLGYKNRMEMHEALEKEDLEDNEEESMSTSSSHEN